MRIEPILLAKGIATMVPGLYKLASKGTGGTVSARYCYSVWLRHLAMAYQSGLSTVPDAVAELGPGDSLGVGLAALLSGASKYYALDIVTYANKERNIKILIELVDLFGGREKIPDEREFPDVKPHLESYAFPNHILTDERLDETLNKGRVQSIRNALLDVVSTDEKCVRVSYFAPWHDPKIIPKGSVDMIFSQAVLEHIDDLSRAYESMDRSLKPGGYMSHMIDFRCHGMAKQWNGHWAYSDLAWKLIRGGRPYLLNRQPHSTHINLLQRLNFEIVCDMQCRDTSGIQRSSLATRFAELCDDDLVTSEAFIQASKRI